MKHLKDYSEKDKLFGAPLSIRVPIKVHQKYINLKGFDKKEFHLKLIKHLMRCLK